jgi:hypothetical protein
MLASSLAFITLFSFSSALDEDSLAEQLEYSLTEKGFEDVCVVLEDGRAIVTYENRIYRDEVEAIRDVMVFTTLFALNSAFDEDSLAEQIKSGLAEKGFEDVRVVLEGGRVIVTSKSKTYQDGVEATREVMASLLSGAKEKLNGRQKTNVTLISQRRKIPIVAISIPENEYLSLLNSRSPGRELITNVDVSLNVGSAWKRTRKVRKAKSSLWKLDIIIHPQFKANFGDYSDPVKAQVNLAPRMTTTLWKGMSISAQVIIPLYNELGELGEYWRPGFLTLNQTLRLPLDTFASATLGYFTQDRYGGDLEVRKYFADGRFSIGANAGYTGFASYLKGVWYYTNIDHLTGCIDARYRISRFNLSLGATYGRFLYKDEGWRFDVFRRFGETGIGFFALKTRGATNGGFSLSIPIFPSRYLPAGRIRVSPAKEFQWEYRYKTLPKKGIQYNTGNRIDDFMKGFEPSYVKNQMAE